ncbi:DUF4231 domain-containing protein [Cyanobacteria bacterium FACHB-63]|nr:DUF4231 domain-containing protein [Cyanobacteria bacterium FACHB-63]
MIDSLEIKDLQKDYLRSRWLDQVLWMEGQAASMRNWHRRLRLTTIIVSGFVPIIISTNFNQENKQPSDWVQVTSTGLSAVVTISSAVWELIVHQVNVGLVNIFHRT